MPRTFLSYRHSDVPANALLLRDSLIKAFGADRVFLDIDAMGPGVPFVERINEAVGGCDVLLALIGPDWIDATDDQGRRRLDQPDDFVRLEIAAALERDILVVPVLVNNAKPPRQGELSDDLKPLAGRIAHEMTHGRWAFDTERLLDALRDLDRQLTEQAPPEPRPEPVPDRTPPPPAETTPPPEPTPAAATEPQVGGADPAGPDPLPGEIPRLTAPEGTPWQEAWHYYHSEGWANPVVVGRWAAAKIGSTKGESGATRGISGSGAVLGAVGLWTAELLYWVYVGWWLVIIVEITRSRASKKEDPPDRP